MFTHRFVLADAKEGFKLVVGAIEFMKVIVEQSSPEIARSEIDGNCQGIPEAGVLQGLGLSQPEED